jgi:hypothetical protein
MDRHKFLLAEFTPDRQTGLGFFTCRNFKTVGMFRSTRLPNKGSEAIFSGKRPWHAVAIVAVSFLFLLGILATFNSVFSFSFATTNYPMARLGSTISINWSGYAITGPKGSVTFVNASWIEPKISGTCPTKNEYSAFWVGIDGYTSHTVEQTGTDSDCNGGSPSYYAWYEFYPAGSVTISSLKISSGDVISAQVTFAGKKFTTKITDVTTGQSYTKTAKVSGAEETSADFITEAPCCESNGNILPLADFGTVNFGGDYTSLNATCYATVSGVTGPIGSFSTVQEITMINSAGTKIKAEPSALSSDGTSFTVTWKSAGP